jgi:hypothetical protein
MATAILVCTVCGCLPAPAEALDSWGKDAMACKVENIYPLALQREKKLLFPKSVGL